MTYENKPFKLVRVQDTYGFYTHLLNHVAIAALQRSEYFVYEVELDIDNQFATIYNRANSKYRSQRIGYMLTNKALEFKDNALDWHSNVYAGYYNDYATFMGFELLPIGSLVRMNEQMTFSFSGATPPLDTVDSLKKAGYYVYGVLTGVHDDPESASREIVTTLVSNKPIIMSRRRYEIVDWGESQLPSDVVGGAEKWVE